MEYDNCELVRRLADMKDLERDKLDEGIPEDPSFFWRLVNLDPALWRGLVVAIFALLSSFGFYVSDEEREALILVLVSVVAIVQGLWTRFAVTPNKKVVVYKPSPVDAPAMVVAGPAVSTDIPAIANAAADNGTNLQSRSPFPEYLGE